MKKSILIVIVILLVIMQSCTCNCNGKYYNTSDGSAVNYIVINTDGTYFQYYKKDTLKFSNNGKWTLSEDGYCTIELENWHNYNEPAIKEKIYESFLFYIDGEYLNEGPEGHDSGSFKKGDK